MSLSFVLHAKNSSDHQMLFVDRDAGEINLTLCGVYEGKDIQIDFNSISGEDLADLIRLLSSRLKEPNHDNNNI